MNEDRRGSAVLKWAFVVVAVALVANATPGFAAAADDDRGIGLSASLQGSQRDIQLPIWTSPKFVFVPSISFLNVSDAGTDIGAGALMRFNIREGQAVPYWGVRLVAFFFSPEGGDSVTDFVIGPALGGEYFLDDHFSIGVEAQLNFAISDKASSRFGNPDGTVINTATAVNATFYF